MHPSREQRKDGYCSALYFLFRAAIASTTIIRLKVRSSVAKVKPNGVRLRKRPTSAVTAKLNPIDKVNLSISSKVFLLGNRVSVRQYPGRKTAKTNANA